MAQLAGLLLFLILLGAFADGSWFGNRSAPGYQPYASNTSPTGYAVTRRYYDFETGDTYSATTPVQLVAYNTRLPRGTINYGGYDFPPMGIQPRSY